LINENTTLKAEIVAADLATDRCFLRVEGELQASGTTRPLWSARPSTRLDPRRD
jgi:hypothetical protein